MSERRHNVLIGSGGTGAAFAALLSLRRNWDSSVHVVVIDTNPARLVAASVLADEFETVPPFSDSGAAEAVCEVAARHSIDTYMPIFDSEVILAARLRDAGRLPAGVRVLSPSTASALICEDKLATYRWLIDQGVPTPFTSELGAGVPPEGWFLKRRRGYGSRGARRVVVNDPAWPTGEERHEYILQALCSPPEVTADVFWARREGLLRVVCRERLETKEGVCTKARVFEDGDLAALARKVAHGLELEGSFCMQVMRGDGEWVVTDINPRCGGGTSMSVPLGIDFFAAAFAHAWREDPRRFLPPLAGEACVVRQYSDVVTARKR